MSNRTLIELNHDFTHYVEGEPEAFARALAAYARSASKENAEKLERWGVKVFGMRHHSEGYRITWGYTKASQSGPAA